MEQSMELLKLLNTLIISDEENMISIHKDSLKSKPTCLQVMQTKVSFLQTWTYFFKTNFTKRIFSILN